MIPVCVLVVAKAPVPGLAKTRLATVLGDVAAADIAACALLDTLDTVAHTRAAARVVALTGDLDDACRADEIRSRLTDFTVISQRGPGFAERLANAHLDAAAVSAGLPVVQIGMDTPQVTPAQLTGCAQVLSGHDAVLGPARDGGWWVLGVRDATSAGCLRQVPMSSPDTGALTLEALRRNGLRVGIAEEMVDVDTVDDIDTVRRICARTSRFRRVTASVQLGER